MKQLAKCRIYRITNFIQFGIMSYPEMKQLAKCRIYRITNFMNFSKYIFIKIKFFHENLIALYR